MIRVEATFDNTDHPLSKVALTAFIHINALKDIETEEELHQKGRRVVTILMHQVLTYAATLSLTDADVIQDLKDMQSEHEARLQ